MKRIIPYFLLQLALSGSLGCAALKGAPQTKAYHITVTTTLTDEAELRSLAANLPGFLLGAKPTEQNGGPNRPLQTLEFQLRDKGNLAQFRQMLGRSGIPVARFQIEEVNL